MKKSANDTNSIKLSSTIDTNFTINKDKTTNVNILLNRVRLDKKKDFRKKITFLFILTSAISFAIFFSII